MSASNSTYMIQRDLIPIVTHKYWYEIQFEPIMESLNIKFELANNVSEIRFTSDFVYNYNSVETDCIAHQTEFNVITIDCAGTLQNVINGIRHIPSDSTEAQEYAKCLIGTTILINKQRVLVTTDNYLQYTSYLVGKHFIDFSLSNQITSIIDELQPTDGSIIHDQVDISYFYEVV